MSWIETCSGLRLDLINPQPEQIRLFDIAVGLSRMPRFAGQLSRNVSVAFHCLFTVRLVQESRQILAILHDAEEAYIGDMPGPLKKHCPDFVEIGDKLRDVIYFKFQCEFTCGDSAAIKKADEIALHVESKFFGQDWCKHAEDNCPYEDRRLYKIANRELRRLLLETGGETSGESIAIMYMREAAKRLSTYVPR